MPTILGNQHMRFRGFYPHHEQLFPNPVKEGLPTIHPEPSSCTGRTSLERVPAPGDTHRHVNLREAYSRLYRAKKER